MIELSIIIPIFNCEKYIKRTLDSIIKQIDTGSNKVEIITINDCSTDKSLSILKKYEKYQFFKIIDLDKNCGVSNARNEGVKQALGRYIMFVDSDDMLIKGSLKHIFDYIRNSTYDVIRFTYQKYYNGIKLPKYNQHCPGNYIISDYYNDNIFKIFLQYYDNNAVWGQIISSKYAKKIKFDDRLIMGEDLAYNMELYFNVNKIEITNVPILYYRINFSSVTHSTNIDKVLKKAASAYVAYYNMHLYDLYNKYEKKINEKVVNVIASILAPVHEENAESFEPIYQSFLSEINSEIEELNNYKYIIKIINSKKQKNSIKKSIKKMLNRR